MPFGRLISKTTNFFRPPGHEYGRTSYSQEGEDLLLARLFDNRTSGFYVDVGAHHPARFSNTYYFYLRGWSGINIDPKSGFQDTFDRYRPRDINLNIGIGKTSQTLTYYEFNEPALNGFDAELARSRDGLRQYRITGTRDVLVSPLSEVLNRHLPAGQAISFLTVDVEGLDIDVLMSNDWDRYRPEAIVAELQDDIDLVNLASCPMTHYLVSVGYRPESKLVKSVLFKRA